MFFEKNLHNEYFVETIDRAEDEFKLLKDQANLEKFKESILRKKAAPQMYQTDALGLSCIRYLAHSYFKNEILPEEWRELISEK